jgi:hypothetical protein
MATDWPEGQARQRQPGAVTPRLLRAYRASDYSVGVVVVRIGRRSAAMDALLARLGARTSVFVTAWNPLSRRMPVGWNKRMQRRLSERLRRYVSLPASGSLRRWSEAHLLVVADARPVMRLARIFRQRGLVVLARHQPARLVLLDWSDTAPSAVRRGHPPIGTQ